MASRLKPVSWFFLSFFLLSFHWVNYAEEEKQDADRDHKEKNWMLSLSGGLTMNAGNTDNKLLNAQSLLTINLPRTRIQSQLEQVYGFSDKSKIADATRFNNRFSRKLGNGLHLSASLSLERDEFAGFALRSNGGLGLECRFQDSDEKRSQLVLTCNGEYINSQGAYPDRKSLRFSVNYSLDRKFKNHAKLSFYALYTPNLADFLVDYRLETKLSFSFLMKDPLWLTIRIHDRFNNLPLAAGIKKNDLTLITAIELTL